MINLLQGFLSKAHKMTKDEFKSLIYKKDSEELKDNALELLLELDTKRISGIKEDGNVDKKEQYDRAMRKVSEKWEKDLKKAFSLDSDLEGDELIAEAVKKKAKGSGDNDGDLTDDKVKAHPLYIDLQNSKKTDIDALKKEHGDKLVNLDNEYKSKATRSSVDDYALRYVKGKNPKNLPEDQKKADKRLRTVLTGLSGYKFEKKGDTFTVKNQDGSVLTDGHDNIISFDELLDSVSVDYFDFEEGDGGKGTGNVNKFGKTRFTNIKVAKNGEELRELMHAAKTTEEKEALSNAYIEAKTPKKD